ncbi:sugar-binding domain-containing protein [Inquilinus sp.]|uniref:sugar-binding domain-containing protein n=1 Tax=Inquilinus sp. TaxID=1932117 RepID=UPI0031CEB76F
MLFATSLAGTWSFALDPDHRGLKEAWFGRELDDTIALPGSVDEARKAPANPDGTMAHLSRRHPYVGRAWYGRSFEVAAEAAGLYHQLVLERPHGEVTVWLGGIKIGRDRSLSTEHRFLLGKLAAGPHRLVLMIDNERVEAVGEAITHAGMENVAHSNTDHTQTNWNGVVGSLRIEASVGAISRVAIHAPTRRARIDIELDGFDTDIHYPTFWTRDAGDRLVLRFRLASVAEPLVIERPVTIRSGFTPVSIDVDLPEATGLWDEFSPVVHRLDVEWSRGGVPVDRNETSFGIRSFTRDGRRLRLNGRAVFLRGTLDCCIFPLTGYPPCDVDGWRKVYSTVQAYGLNHVRFHSYCPPEAAFVAADEMGVLLHVETPVWAVLGSDPNLDRFIHEESERIVRAYGNHPSFVMMAVGNEPHGPGLHAFLSRWVAHWTEADPRRLYTGCSGWPTIAEADYASKPEPRSQRWGEGLAGRLNAQALETMTDWSAYRDAVDMPLVTHEMGQWCVFPNLDEIEKYRGVVEARNFARVRDDLAAKGMLDLARDFLVASGSLQTKLYKEDIESALRTRDLAGIQLLGLQDFPGQGTALVGVVDAFWDQKPYVSPEAFREFCAPVVPLVRSERFVATRGEPIRAAVEVAQFGPADIEDAVLRWSLADDSGTVIDQGEIRARRLTTGDLHRIADLAIETSALAQGRYELLLELAGTGYRNRWGYWIFEKASGAVPLEIVADLNEAVLSRIEAGETIVWSPDPKAIRQDSILGFTTVFWNTLWTRRQPPHTLGLLIDQDHPIFSAFPSGRASDWHWWELVHGRAALDLCGLGLSPIVRVIDDWNSNRDLALLAECRIGRGRLVISAIDLASDLDRRPVASAMRHALAQHLVRDREERQPAILDRKSVLDWSDDLMTRGGLDLRS